MTQFEIKNKTVCVFECEKADKPVIYLNTYGSEGGAVYDELIKTGCADFNLVTVSGLEWNNDMTPWKCPPVIKNGEPFTGGADNYLVFLLQDVVTAAEKKITGTPAWRGIAGYSLGGLFAVYSLYKTDVFKRVASASGSLWFPGFKEFVFENKMKAQPERVYFSVGNKESKTRNEYMKAVENNTREIENYFRSQKIKTIFELNPGNHFQNAAQRTARSIQWLVSE